MEALRKAGAGADSFDFPLPYVMGGSKSYLLYFIVSICTKTEAFAPHFKFLNIFCSTKMHLNSTKTKKFSGFLKLVAEPSSGSRGSGAVLHGAVGAVSALGRAGDRLKHSLVRPAVETTNSAMLGSNHVETDPKTKQNPSSTSQLTS